MCTHCHTCFFLLFRRFFFFFFEAGLIEQPTYFLISIVHKNGGIIPTIFAFFFLFVCCHHGKNVSNKIQVKSSHHRKSYLEHEIRVLHFLCCARPLFVFMCRRRWASDSAKVIFEILLIVRRLLIYEMRQDSVAEKPNTMNQMKFQ